MKALRIILKEKYWGKAIGIHVRNHVRDAGAWVGVSAGLGAVAASATGDRKIFN